MKLLMPEQIDDFNPRGRILAMDIGKKTIGLAVTNSALNMALPLRTIRRRKFTIDIQELESIIMNYDITDYVLGWPLHMDGSLSPGCDRTQSFADEIMKSPDIFGRKAQVLLWDERLSTEAVQEMVDKPVDKMKESGQLDALAALIILEEIISKLEFRYEEIDTE